VAGRVKARHSPIAAKNAPVNDKDGCFFETMIVNDD
jgi:hypothetical protein